MKVANPKLLLALVSAAAVTWLVWSDLKRTSPGPLAWAHAEVPELLGSEGCAQCHGSEDAGMAAGCGACHEEIAVSLDRETGLHGTLDQDCSRCHVEHHGADFPLVDAVSFELAGFARREDFDHSVVDFGLLGRHAELECAECHRNADVEHLVAGEKRFLGLVQDCATCHEDAHEGRMIRACADCHGQGNPFDEVAAFDHEALSLEGGHAGLSCSVCHPLEGPRAVVALGSGSVADVRSCAECHESSHSEAFLANSANCNDCHIASHETFLGQREDMPRKLHAATGFDLTEGHAGVACDACHGPSKAGFADRFPGRIANDCAACHTDPHDAQFEERSCNSCHNTRGFEPSSFDREQHGLTSFALEGAHAETQCSSCHVNPQAAETRVFAGLAGECASCHKDAHRGLLVSEAADDCSRCHITTTFSEGARNRFVHDEDTTFALRGSHERADCEACHQPRASESRVTSGVGGRLFGFASEFADGSVQRCVSCHADPHFGTFSGRADDCAQCHTEESFLVDEFEHGFWTGFALEGTHLAADCASCHPRGPELDVGGFIRRSIRDVFGSPTQACATCHDSPHSEDFLTASGEGCAECHGTESFVDLLAPFDHEESTGYPLSPEHAALACVACHEPNQNQQHGAALGRSCADCHADPHAGQFRIAGQTDCARCHADAGGLVFDHGRDSVFALDETHAALDCAACHKPWVLANGDEVIRYSMLGTTCKACHGPAPPSIERGKR